MVRPRAPRVPRVAAWVLWPAGLVLVLASALRPAVPLAAFVALDLAYVVGAVVLVRTLGGGRTDRPRRWCWPAPESSPWPG